MKTTALIFAIIALAISLASGYTVYNGIQKVGSITQGQEYSATTTPLAQAWTDRQLDTGPGTLGSVVITSQGNVQFDLLDSLDAGRNVATGTLVSIPRNAAVGTYVFDIAYSEGLYIDVLEGTLGTSTITYRK